MFKLGIFWFCGSPEKLYKFDYFKFNKGRGGFADRVANLKVEFESQYIDNILGEINELTTRYPYYSNLFIYYDHNSAVIGISSYTLFDYDFSFALEIEKILARKKVKLIDNIQCEHKNLQRYNTDPSSFQTYSDKIMIGFCGSHMTKYGAETLNLRIDCNIKKEQKNQFIYTLTDMVKAHNIHIFYYYEKDIGDRTNLILFLTNGRQGCQLAQPQFIDIKKLAAEIEHLFSEFDLLSGLLGGMDYYPIPSENRKPNIQLMIDDEVVNSLMV